MQQIYVRPASNADRSFSGPLSSWKTRLHEGRRRVWLKVLPADVVDLRAHSEEVAVTWFTHVEAMKDRQRLSTV